MRAAARPPPTALAAAAAAARPPPDSRRPPGFTVLQEGRARILSAGGNEVFYNKAQVTNRDLSILVIRRFIELRAAELAAGTLKTSFAGKKKEKRDKARAEKVAATAAAAGDGADAAGAAAAPGDADGGGASTSGGAAAGAAGVRILEGLSATGLRALRYALEIDGISRIDANDLARRRSCALARTQRCSACCSALRRRRRRALPCPPAARPLLQPPEACRRPK